MTASRAARPPTTPLLAAAERAIGALEALLAAQRAALVAGDVGALSATHSRINTLLSDPAWRRDVARGRSPQRVRAALRAAALNAGLAARGEAQAARALAAIGHVPSVYTARGALDAGAGRSRGRSA